MEQSDNPFALVVLAVFAAIEKGEAKDDEIMLIKRRLVRLLLERNYEKETIVKLFRFINHYIRFENPKNYAIFAQDIQSKFLNQKKNMGIEEILIEDARQEGIEKGIEKGREAAVSEKDYQFTKSLLLSTDFDDAKIALLVGVTAEYVSNLRASLS